jgi:hypothetical protein
MQQIDDIAAAKEQSDESLPLQPMTTLLDWQSWEEGLIVRAQTMRNLKTGVRLDYLMRKHEVVEPGMRDTAQYECIDDHFIATIVMEGVEHKKDNKRMFDLFRSALKGTSAEPFMKGYTQKKDFRGAYLAVKRQAEGQSARTTRLGKAYGVLSTSTYTGKGKFTLLQYTSKMVKAHNELADLLEPMSETKKVADFMKGIKDPKLAVGKTVVDGDNHKLTDFEACQQYFATLVVNGSTRDQGEARHLSKLEKAKQRRIARTDREDKSNKSLVGTFKGKVEANKH